MFAVRFTPVCGRGPAYQFLMMPGGDQIRRATGSCPAFSDSTGGF